MKIRGINTSPLLQFLSMEIEHPATGEKNVLQADIAHFEQSRVAFFGEQNKSPESDSEKIKKTTLEFVTGWDFVDDETGEKVPFSKELLGELLNEKESEWVALDFFTKFMPLAVDRKNFYAEPNKI